MNLGECEIIDEIDFRELEQIPHAIVKEGKLEGFMSEEEIEFEGELEGFMSEEIEFEGELEGFMSEEEIEFQDIDKCKIVELPDKQEIERCTSPEMPVRIVYEQEECIKEEICNRSLPKLPKMYRAKESVHTDEIKLEMTKMNVVEINELPKEVKLKMPIEQIESKTKQNVNLVSDITPFHAECDILLSNRTVDLCGTPPFEISVASSKILG